MTAIDPFKDLVPETATAWWAATDRWQRLFIAGGSALLLLGVLAPVLLPAWAGPAGMLATVAVLGGLIGLTLAVRDRYGGRLTRRPPAVEERPQVRRAGEDFDTTVRRAVGEVTGRAIRAESNVRERLRSVSLSVLARTNGADQGAVADRLDAGEWPDPETGSALFRPGRERRRGWLRPALEAEPSLPGRIATVLDRLEDHLGGSVRDADASAVLPQRPRAGEWAAGPYRTGRWAGLVGVGLLVLMAGALGRAAGPTLVAAVLLGLAGYVRLLDPPEIRLGVERSLDPADPVPGQTVAVTVTVENEGDHPILDLRLVDGVPEGLTVVDGSPRHATALASGERDSFTYAVPAVAGEYDFSTLHVEAREPSGERARTETVETSSTTLACDPRPPGGSVPLHPQATGLTGRVPTAEGGSGVEFHSVREYRPGDPLSRVDWNRLARTGDLATRQHREEHAATVVLLVDVRGAAAVAPTVGELSAVDRARFGTARLVDSLIADGDRVGLATVETDPTWVPPGGGTVHRERLEGGLRPDGNGSDPLVTFSPARYVRQLRRRLPAASQLLCVSPLVDDDVVSVLRHLHAHGHEVSLISPDPTTRATLGARVARLERQTRVTTLRDAGIRVIDWPHGDDLSVALERARRGWGT